MEVIKKKDRRTYLNLQYKRFRGVGKYDIPIIKKRKQKEINYCKTEIAAFREIIHEDTEKIKRYKEDGKS